MELQEVTGNAGADSGANAAFRRLSAFGASTFASALAEMVLRVIKNAVFTRLLGPEGRGLYGLFIAIPQMSVSFGSLGYGLGSVYLAARERSKLRKIYGNALVSAFIQGGILLVAGLLVSRLGFVSGWNEQAVEQFGAFVLAAIPLLLALSFSQDILMGIKDIHCMNLLLIAFSALPIALIFFIRYLTADALFSAQLSWIISAITVAVAGYIRLAVKAGGWPRFSLRLMRKAYSFGLRGNISMFANKIVRRIDLLFIAAYLDVEQVGFYAVAVSVAELLLALPSAVSVPFLPIRMGMDKSSGKELTPFVAKYVLLFMAPACLATGLLGKLIITILFGADFLPAYSSLVWLLPGMLSLSIYQFAKADAYSMEHPGVVSAVSIVTMICNLALNWVLIPRMGLVGAAVASSISYTVSTVLLVAFVIHKAEYRASEVLVLRRSDFALIGDSWRHFRDRRRGKQ